MSLRALLLAGLLALFAGCFDPGAVCGDGRCPDGTICDLDHLRCIYPEQLTSCVGIVDGTACEIAEQNVGVCVDEVCLRTFCGDGMVVAPEQCDGADLAGRTCLDLIPGNHGNGRLGCRADCTFDLTACGDRCGDGVIQAGEECDLGDLGGQTCGTRGFHGGELTCDDCRIDVSACAGRCGDGVRTAGEVCDGTDFGARSCTTEGFYGGDLGCSATCDAILLGGCVGECGDNIKNGPEICDGTDHRGLGCETYGWYAGELGCQDDCVNVDQSQCRDFCGDGVVNGNELCDGFDMSGETCGAIGAAGGALGCNAFCQPTRDRCFWGRLRAASFGTQQQIITVWASGPDDFWGVGENGTVVHHDGVRWRVIDTGHTITGRLREVTGARNDIYVGGDDGVMLHYDGATWTRIETGFTDTIYDIFVAGPDDLWVVTQTPVWRRTGGAWRQVDVGGRQITDAWGAAADDIWLVGHEGAVGHWDGETLTFTSIGPYYLQQVWGTARDDVWVTGFGGAIQHFDGREWTRIDVTTDDMLFGWSHGRNDVWLGGFSGRLLHYDGVRWANVGGPQQTAMISGFGVDGSHIWLSAGFGALRFDGVGWQDRSLGGTDDLYSVWSSGPDDAWVAGENGVLAHWDGGSWTRHPIATGDLSGLWGSGPRDVYVVGVGGAAFHYDGDRWTRLNLGVNQTFYDVWGSGPHDVYIIGLNHAFLHYDGISWRQVEPGRYWGHLTKIHGNSARDIWVHDSYNQDVEHFDGTRWTRMSAGLSERIDSMWSSGPNELYVFGINQTRRFDGVRWQDVTPTWPLRIHGSLDDAWADGPGTTAMHYDGSVWSQVDIFSGHVPFRFGGSGRGNTWAIADDGMVLQLPHDMPRDHGGVCAQPIALGCNTEVFGTTRTDGPRHFDRYACTETDGVRDTPGSETYYVLTSPVNGRISVELMPSVSDLDLFVLGDDAGRCDPDRCLVSEQRDTPDRWGDVDVLARVGQTMYVVVDSPDEQSTSYRLKVVCDKL